MNRLRTHEWVDRRSLALAQAVAARLADRPELLEVAHENIRRWKARMDPWPPALREWEQILAQGASTAVSLLTEDSERGRRLRRSSPFAGVLSPAKRKAVFDLYESLPA